MEKKTNTKKYYLKKRPVKPKVQKKNPPQPTSNLKIIPLGGFEEIGKNITVFEYEDDIVILDCGVAFPDEEMFGVDLVIPDMTYLYKNRDKIRGLIITHGHEDHIGAIPYLLKDINVPIYATKLTLGILTHKLEEHGLLKTAKLNVTKPGQILKFGSIKAEFIRTNHSIADSVAIAFHTPVGVVLHTGDFKIDSTPIDGEMLDFARIGELGKKGILALLSDSTNVERPGYSMSERKVGDTFEEIFSKCNSRIIVATFASNVHRVQQIIDAQALQPLPIFPNGIGGEPILVVILEPPGGIHGSRGFVQSVGGIFVASHYIGIGITFFRRYRKGIFIIPQGNIVVSAVAQPGIDQALRLILLDGIEQTLALLGAQGHGHVKPDQTQLAVVTQNFFHLGVDLIFKANVKILFSGIREVPAVFPGHTLSPFGI